MPDRMHGTPSDASWLMPLLLVAVVVCAGIGFRWVGLGDRPLEESELLHYFVARSLNDGAGPVLPSGNGYSRGLENSQMIAVALEWIEPPELAVRIPSALLGSLSLLLFAMIVWSIAGPWPALGAVALQSLYPEALDWSRTGRFYSLQLLAGLVVLYAGWRIFAPSAGECRPTRGQLLRRWSWAVVATVCLAFAAGVQIVTLSVVIGLAVALVIAALRDVHERGGAAIRASVPVQIFLLASLIVPLVLLLNPRLPVNLLDQARSVPFWARQAGDVPGPLFYVYALMTSIPLVASFGSFAFLLLLARRPWLGIYLLTWFAVPFLIHSLFLSFRQERYIMLAMPALFMAVGIVAAWAGEALHREMKAALIRWTGRVRLSRALAGLLVGLAALGALGPATASAAKLVRDDLDAASTNPHWDRMQRLIADDPDLVDLPIGSGHPLPALYYLGRVSFSVRRGLLERPAGHQALMQTGHAFRWESDGAPDYYAGVPVLSDPAAIRERFEKAGGVLIVLGRQEFDSANTTPSLRRVLEAEARELCLGTCGSVKLYHWHFATT